MDNSSSSNNSAFYHPRNQIFSRNPSYQETLPTAYSQDDRSFRNDFPSTQQPFFDQNTGLETVGFGPHGYTFDQQQVLYPPITTRGVQETYDDVTNRPSLPVYDEPWTPAPVGNGYNDGYAGFQTARSTASGSANEVGYDQYQNGYYHPPSHVASPPSSTSAMNAATTSSIYPQSQYVPYKCQHQDQHQQRSDTMTASPTTSQSHREARVAIPRQEAVRSSGPSRRELRYPCSVGDCNLIYHDKSELKRHLGTGHGIVESHWRCIVCQRAGNPFERTRKDKVVEHCRTVHKQKKCQERVEEVAGSPATEAPRRAPRAHGPGRRHP